MVLETRDLRQWKAVIRKEARFTEISSKKQILNGKKLCLQPCAGNWYLYREMELKDEPTSVQRCFRIHIVVFHNFYELLRGLVFMVSEVFARKCLFYCYFAMSFLKFSHTPDGALKWKLIANHRLGEDQRQCWWGICGCTNILHRVKPQGLQCSENQHHKWSHS